MKESIVLTLNEEDKDRLAKIELDDWTPDIGQRPTVTFSAANKSDMTFFMSIIELFTSKRFEDYYWLH